MSDSLPELFTMEPFVYLDETMQHTIQDSRNGGVADIDFSHQVAHLFLLTASSVTSCIHSEQTITHMIVSQL